MTGRDETESIIAALSDQIERSGSDDIDTLHAVVRRLRYLQAMADSRAELISHIERLAGAASILH